MFNFKALAVLAGLALVSSTPAAHAVELKRSGASLLLQGPLNWGDHHVFKAFVDAQPPGIRTVVLNSGGGSVEAAQEIGRRIRKEGWATLVDARRARCASACTAIFAAGTARHYVGADGIADGAVAPKAMRGGLAYHQGSSPQSLHANHYSGGASAYMVAVYYEFGSRGAASIIDLAAPNMLYAISGRTALEKGIATSLATP
ncbi:hypothetical protein [uncultured Alsobacter sp.]|uniref:hypothetical protein n=1 Tax=uncultured Alsobacter sp. TaxID=1748258 RepID=UPI0025F1D71F|nr:hypothetical protein [uncultured Alsobacter sp.]